MLRLGEPDRACTEYLALTLTPDGIELIQMLGGTLSVLSSAAFPSPGGANRSLEVEFDGATVTVREANVATPLLDAIPVGVLGGGERIPAGRGSPNQVAELLAHQIRL